MIEREATEADHAVAFILSEADCLAAYRLAQRRRRTLSPYLAMILGGFAMAVFGSRRMPWVLLVWALVGGGIGGIVGSSVARWFARYVTLPRRVNCIYRQQASLRAKVRLEWNAESICFDSESACGHLPLADIFAKRESDDMILLYSSEDLYSILPKRAFSATQLSAFKQRIAGIVTR